LYIAITPIEDGAMSAFVTRRYTVSAIALEVDGSGRGRRAGGRKRMKKTIN
jgi:hypothetical protein